ncbi:hypothetical protein Tsubulata_011162 [Turnera subulata]|uniref:Uncharacterized protein n=1 Tax=Turnera subulata TaxID=218843 RepID=A0A9Q0J372_9ROSI|nr:hypothetical protein Tsubulata_011162 [Turnera subulata]
MAALSSTLLNFSCLSSSPQGLRRTRPRFLSIRAEKPAEPEKEKATPAKTEASSSNAQPKSSPTKPKKPVYSMKKGQIVRVDKEKYLNSINYLSVGHPPYYKGLDYIYEDRGEVLDLRIFETGEYALTAAAPSMLWNTLAETSCISWVGIPTAPAWLPTDMLIKSEKLNYERL